MVSLQVKLALFFFLFSQPLTVYSVSTFNYSIIKPDIICPVRQKNLLFYFPPSRTFKYVGSEFNNISPTSPWRPDILRLPFVVQYQVIKSLNLLGRKRSPIYEAAFFLETKEKLPVACTRQYLELARQPILLNVTLLHSGDSITMRPLGPPSLLYLLPPPR